MFELRPYQQACISRIVASYKKNNSGRELVVLPTGAGKTVVFCKVIQRLGLNTLIIAHRDELLEQAADKYRAIKPDAVIGKVGSGVHEYSSEVTVASVATISRPEQVKLLKAMDYRLIIIDEAHHAASESYQKVLAALPGAFVLMVTATADRLDGRDIIDKEPLFSCSIIDMVEQRYLCDIRAIAIATDTDLDGIHTRMGDYNEKELDLAVNTDERNNRVVEAYQQHAPGRTGICFAVTVKHAEALAEAFNEHGIPAGTVSGDTPIEERRKLYKSLRDGTLKVLTNVQVLTEGFDEPAISCVIMARPTQSRALYVQCVGRGLRLAPDKPDCLILDLTDNCMRHRLEPQNLSKALGEPLSDGKSVLQMKRKNQEEEEEREEQKRLLKERRVQDIPIDIRFAPVSLFGHYHQWETLPDGALQMKLCSSVIRIRQMPATQHYYVIERNEYYQTTRTLIDSVPLTQARQVAEVRLDEITAEIQRRVAQRQAAQSPTDKQIETLRKFRIALPPDCTKQQASELISTKIAGMQKGRAS